MDDRLAPIGDVLGQPFGESGKLALPINAADAAGAEQPPLFPAPHQERHPIAGQQATRFVHHGKRRRR
jgi:hypothetical protein